MWTCRHVSIDVGNSNLEDIPLQWVRKLVVMSEFIQAGMGSKILHFEVW